MMNEKRATKYAIISILLIWLAWEGYLSFLIAPLGIIGIFWLCHSLIVGTIIF